MRALTHRLRSVRLMSRSVTAVPVIAAAFRLTSPAMSVPLGTISIMSIREVQVTFDCADPGALAGFWCEVLGYQVQPPPPGFESWDKALAARGVPPEERNSRSAALPGSAAK